LARGVDKFAHLGCLEACKKSSNWQNFYFNKSQIGKTIAVLGSGIENIYPFENIKVYEKILETGGAIISEYSLGTKPFSYNFPYRNRIISGLSDKIILIQASYKSGSLITVDYALEQGRDIFVLENKNINEPAFEGNKILINQGAETLKFLY